MHSASAVIVIGDACETLDTMYPIFRLQEAGIEPVIAAPEMRPYQTVMHEIPPGWTITRETSGYTLTPDATFSDIDPTDHLGLFLTGGRAPEYLRYDPELIRIVQQFAIEQKSIASICHGIEILATADLVRGRRFATVAKCRFDLEVCGGIYTDRPCVVDGPFVSARTWRDNGPFCGTWVQMMQSAIQK